MRWPAAASTNVIGISPDGKRLAVAEADGIGIRAFDTGEMVNALRGFSAPAARMTITADGVHVVTQFDRPEGGDTPIAVALSKPDDPRPAAFRLAVPASFTLWDVAPGPLLAVGTARDGELARLALDGKQAARTYAIAPLTQTSLVRLAPDGKTAIVKGNTGKDDDEAAYLVDLADGKMRPLAAKGPDASVTGVAYSRDGKRFALGFRDGSAEILETGTGRPLKKLPPYSDGGDTRPLAFSPDGTLLAGGAIFDDNVFVWNIDSGKVLRTIALPDSLAGYRIATAVALSHDKKTLAVGLGQRAVSSGDVGSEVGGIYAFDLATGKRRFTLRGHQGSVRGLAFSPNDGMIISTSSDGTARYWDNANGKLLATAAATPDGRWFVLSEAGFYAGSEGSAELAASIVRGTGASPAATARDLLSRPDLIEALLKGDPGGQYRAAAKALDLAKIAPAKR